MMSLLYQVRHLCSFACFAIIILTRGGKHVNLRDLCYLSSLGSLFTDKKGLEKLLNLKGARIIAVKNPTPGLWKVKASSGGSHTLRITGLSSMYITSGFGLRPVKHQDEAIPQPVAGQ